ncbi:MAG: hypothetical protein ACI3XW_08320, partial [Butyricicoccus sp.]
ISSRAPSTTQPTLHLQFCADLSATVIIIPQDDVFVNPKIEKFSNFRKIRSCSKEIEKNFRKWLTSQALSGKIGNVVSKR